jgi:hypothetical protein
MSRTTFEKFSTLSSTHACAIQGVRDSDGQVYGWISIKDTQQIWFAFVFSKEQIRVYVQRWAQRERTNLFSTWEHILEDLPLCENSIGLQRQEIHPPATSLFMFNLLYYIIRHGADDIFDLPEARPDEWQRWGEERVWWLFTTLPTNNRPLMAIGDDKFGIIITGSRATVQKAIDAFKTRSRIEVQGGEFPDLDHLPAKMSEVDDGSDILLTHGAAYIVKRALFFYQALMISRLKQ